MIPFKNILCPVDFSEPSYNALSLAQELAEHFSAKFYLVHVVNPVPFLPTPATSGILGIDLSGFDVPTYQEALKKTAEKNLKEAAKERIPERLNVEPIVRTGNPADEIVKMAEEKQVDLIVIATHGRTGWKRFMTGSVTEKVVRIAQLPVLTVQAPHTEE